MASRYQIQMNFSQAERKAAELDDIAGDLSRLSGTDLQNTLNSLGNNWKGENAGLYIGKGFQLIENMEKTAASLRQAAETIRSVARNIYNAEMEALRIAEEREAAASHSINLTGTAVHFFQEAAHSAEAHFQETARRDEVHRAAETAADMIRTAFSTLGSAGGKEGSSGTGGGGNFSGGGGNGGGGGGGGRF